MNDNLLNEYKIAATEVLDILEYLPKYTTNRIPKSFMHFLEGHSEIAYKPQFDYSKGIDKLQLNNKTRALLAMVYRNYICSEEERKTYDEILCKNEEEYQKTLYEKYNPNNIFKKNKEAEVEAECKELISYKKEKWYTRILNKLNLMKYQNKKRY